MDTIREFLGLLDIEYIALHLVFPGSLATLASPVIAEGQWPVVIEAPEHQINFLYPLIRRMLKKTPLSDDGEGWVGVMHRDATHLNLYYSYEDPRRSTITLLEKNIRRLELLQSKFRADAARYADLMFEKISLVEIVSEKMTPIFKEPMVERVELPPGFKNGTITLPTIWLH